MKLSDSINYNINRSQTNKLTAFLSLACMDCKATDLSTFITVIVAMIFTECFSLQ